MATSRILIISPSGNFYGSEQVLFDYLSHTAVRADVAVPANSDFYKKLKSAATIHSIKTFQSSKLISYYFQLFFKLLVNRYRAVYLNEAGHGKFILLLAKVFPKKKFVIHVRLTEDTVKDRWIVKPGKNVAILSISNYIVNHLPFTSTLLYDPYPFGKLSLPKTSTQKQFINIGVIGRITYTKGMNYLLDLLTLVKRQRLTDHYKFSLFGTLSEDAIAGGVEEKLKVFENVKMCGFEPSKEKIYSAVDCVLHLSIQEPLGRIFLETIDAEKPFIGINAAGIGEIATLLNIQELMADAAGNDLIAQLIKLLDTVRLNYSQQSNIVADKKTLAAIFFSIDNYTRTVDKLLIS
jgi:glycosyltransferase involved in cell wall biosynthesis